MTYKLKNVTINEVSCFLSRGITPVYVNDDGTLVLNQKCIRDGKVDFSLSRYHDQTKRKISKDKFVKKYDVLVNSTGVGTLGRVAQIIKDDIATVDTHITIVRPDPKKIDPHYFGFVMRLNQAKIEALAEGSTGQTELGRTVLGNLKLSIIDDKRIQSRVAEVLSNIDEKIWLNNFAGPTIESLANLIFNSWFIKFEPVKIKIAAKINSQDPELAVMEFISGKTSEELEQLPEKKLKKIAELAAIFPNELEETAEGPIPKGWSWKPLYDTAEYVNGAAFTNSDFSSEKEGMPIIKIAELKTGISFQTKFTTKAMPAKFAIDSGALLYSWSGSPETSLEVFKWFGGKGWLNQHIFLVKNNSAVKNVYAYNLLKYLKPQLINIAKNKQTTGLGHVTVADMKRIMIPYPDDKALNLVEQYLSPLYQIDSNNTMQNENLKKQRDLLIPKLLSGELQLN